MLYVVNLLWAAVNPSENRLSYRFMSPVTSFCWCSMMENLQHRFSWKHRKTLSVQTLDMFQWSTLCWMNGNVSYVFLLLLVLMSFIHAGLTQGNVLYCSIFDLLNKCELCCSLFVYMDHMRIPHLSLCWWFMSIFCCLSPSPRIICLCNSSWC